MVSPQHMVFSEVLTRDPAQGHEFRMPTIEASRSLGTEPFIYFGFSTRCAGRISRGPHDHGFSPSSAKLVIWVLFSTAVLPASSAERAGRAHSADEADTAFRLRSDHRDVGLSHVLFHCYLDRAFPFLLRVPKPLMESGIVPA